MKYKMDKNHIRDLLFAPFTYLAAIWLRRVRSNISSMRISKKILMKVGVFPIIDAYWEPLFNPKRLRHSLREERILPGIDLNKQEQLGILNKFKFNDELLKFPVEKVRDGQFCYNNGSFSYGDAEYLYNMIRLFKPRKIVEIGSGNSTLMAMNAIKANKDENPRYDCMHLCIEPYECPWLDMLGLKILRKQVEDVEKNVFTELEKNDFLFIDSSHIIRPQGDVLFEYLEILPILKPGVIVHIHDIFTPRDYPDEWVIDSVRLWNEQYLLEAFLTMNRQYKIIGALNYLRHHHFSELSEVCPFLKDHPSREPASFYLVRV